jgi:alanyl aminopeptidase
MFEAWLGPGPFRKGVQTYLERHAWGNATAADFLGALSEATGRDVAPVFSSFVDQTGAPVVSAALECDGAPRVALSQRPYRRLGSPEVAKTWQVPVCVRTSAAAPACEVLGGKAGTLALGGTCPTWDLPNAGMSGYFRVRMTGREMLDALEPGRLSKAERVGLIGDVRALVDSGDLPAADALRVVAHEAQDPDHQVILALASIVDGLDQHVPAALRPRYAAFVRDLFTARARTLGWRARPGETDNTRLLRRSVLWRAAGLGAMPTWAARRSPWRGNGWPTRRPSMRTWWTSCFRSRPGTGTDRSSRPLRPRSRSRRTARAGRRSTRPSAASPIRCSSIRRWP